MLCLFLFVRDMGGVKKTIRWIDVTDCDEVPKDSVDPTVLKRLKQIRVRQLSHEFLQMVNDPERLLTVCTLVDLIKTFVGFLETEYYWSLMVRSTEAVYTLKL